MDYTTIDITDVPGADVGDRVTIIGEDGDLRQAVEDVADVAGVAPYNVLCGIGRRVVRRPFGETS